MKKLLIAVSTILLSVSGIAQQKENDMNSVFEIAINQANEGGLDNFLETREKFVEVLGKEEATLNEGKWKPFFAVNPDYQLENILIGMTEWNSF